MTLWLAVHFILVQNTTVVKSLNRQTLGYHLFGLFLGIGEQPLCSIFSFWSGFEKKICRKSVRNVLTLPYKHANFAQFVIDRGEYSVGLTPFQAWGSRPNHLFENHYLLTDLSSLSWLLCLRRFHGSLWPPNHWEQLYNTCIESQPFGSSFSQGVKIYSKDY